MTLFEPAYVKTDREGLLKKKIEDAWAVMSSCSLCPRQCGIDRTSGETGICNTADKAMVSSYNPHFGEEAPLVGANGSGTIFFTHCNLMCLFCQNYDISHEGHGVEVTPDQIASMMLELQDLGCHNINFVTPSHVVPQIIKAVKIGARKGLSIPLVYNSGGYDRLETLQLIDGIFDIYMPDFKFWDKKVSESVCDARDYPETAKQALIEMHRQVGDLTINDDGIAERGLLIRHLVMPGGLAGTDDVMRFIAETISINTYINIMFQYRPCGRAGEVDLLSDYPTENDFIQAMNAAKQNGLSRIDKPRDFFRRLRF